MERKGKERSLKKWTVIQKYWWSLCCRMKVRGSIYLNGQKYSVILKRLFFCCCIFLLPFFLYLLTFFCKQQFPWFIIDIIYVMLSNPSRWDILMRIYSNHFYFERRKKHQILFRLVFRNFLVKLRSIRLIVLFIQFFVKGILSSLILSCNNTCTSNVSNWEDEDGKNSILATESKQEFLIFEMKIACSVITSGSMMMGKEKERQNQANVSNIQIFFIFC